MDQLNKLFQKIKLLSGFFSDKINQWGILLSVILLFVIYLLLADFSHQIIFPKKDNTSFEFYTDKNNGGNSEVISKSISDTSIEFNYKLNDGFFTPYVGISFSNNVENLFHFGNYNRLLIEVSGEEQNRIGISLYVKDTSNFYNSDICFYKDIDISDERYKFIVYLDEFIIPEWWYASTNTSLEKIIVPNFDQINRINIGNAVSSASNIKRTLKIYSIRFYKDNSDLLMLLIIVELVFIVMLSIFYLYKKSKKNPVTITYKTVNIENECKHFHKYLDYIHDNFHDPNLTLENVSKNTGINKRRITNLIQEQFGCNFKTYVNTLRIDEAKKLLLDSELSKIEITFKVGFSNQTNFNRVFKSLEGITPSNYIKSKKN